MEVATPRARTRRTRPPITLAAVAGVAIAVRTLLVVPVEIAGASMEPTLHPGDVTLVWRAARTAADLRRGDLVVFHGPDGGLTVKRAVGLPGDRVVVLDAVLVVNGVPVDEPYVDHSTVDGTYLPQVTVPEGAVWVLGDNRALSVDSWEIGPVRERDLVGRVLLSW